VGQFRLNRRVFEVAMYPHVLTPCPTGLRGLTEASRRRQACAGNKADRQSGNRQRTSETGQLLIFEHCISPSQGGGCHLKRKCAAANKLSNIELWSILSPRQIDQDFSGIVVSASRRGNRPVAEALNLPVDSEIDSLRQLNG
jgi:hypothetical protein